jgi:hypothetical protein
MKIKAVKTFWGSVPVDDDPEATLAEALREDHPCDDASCGISAALRHGYTYAAARLLLGATDAPAVDYVRTALRFNGTPVTGSMLRSGFDEWCESDVVAEAVECPECDAYLYDADPDAFVCPNCGHCVQVG